MIDSYPELWSNSTSISNDGKETATSWISAQARSRFRPQRPFTPPYAKNMDQTSHLPSPQSLCDADEGSELNDDQPLIDDDISLSEDTVLFTSPTQPDRPRTGSALFPPLPADHELHLDMHRTPPTSPAETLSPEAANDGVSRKRSASAADLTTSPPRTDLQAVYEQYATIAEQNIMIQFVSTAWNRVKGDARRRELQLRSELERRNGFPWRKSSWTTKPTRMKPLSQDLGTLPPVQSPSQVRQRERKAVGTVSSKSRDHQTVIRASPSGLVPTAPVHRQIDTDWKSIPDYAPQPINLEPDNRHGLKITVRTTSKIDLSKLPNVELLHPSEITAASELRLTPDQYLTVKRKIFQARFTALQTGRAWNKTAAQAACKIDVNKTSSLWAAYERLGWFDPSLMTEHLIRARKARDSAGQ